MHYLEGIEMLTDISLSAIARHLNLRRRLSTPMVLILGSRTGALYRSQEFYTILEPHSSTFTILPKVKQFAECYRILTRQPVPGFSPNDIHTILTDALNTIDTIDSDKYLANFVKMGIFDPIITTNIDTLIQDALTSAGWRNTREFEVLSLPEVSSGQLGYRRRTARQIIHVFGQITSRQYKIRERIGFLQNQPSRVQHLLNEIFARDVVTIGLDPLWDAEIYRFFSPRGDSLWFINEEPLSEDSALYRVAEVRNGRTLTGSGANYEHFMEQLHEAMTVENPPEVHSKHLPDLAISSEEMNKSKPTNPAQSGKSNNSDEQDASTAANKRLNIYISSVPEDDKLLRVLLNHLTTLKFVDTWHSHKILGGQVTQTEIDQHLQSSHIILLLVSADFLASDYINSSELRRAMEMHRTGKAVVIPIIARSCYWQSSIFGSLNPLPGNGQPIRSRHWPDQHAAFLDIVQGIKEIAAKNI